MKLGRITVIVGIFVIGLSTIVCAQSTSKSVVTEITPGGRTIGGPVAYATDTTGVGGSLYTALLDPQPDVCITFAFVEGKTQVFYFTAPSGDGNFFVEGNPLIYCVPKLMSIIFGCVKPPCRFVYRIDKAN
jgi:hypothetical protein